MISTPSLSQEAFVDKKYSGKGGVSVALKKVYGFGGRFSTLALFAKNRVMEVVLVVVVEVVVVVVGADC